MDHPGVYRSTTLSSMKSEFILIKLGPHHCRPSPTPPLSNTKLKVTNLMKSPFVVQPLVLVTNFSLVIETLTTNKRVE